ncbi:FMN-dependent NADH-azoreductase [Aminobacter aminovorans]|uniref:FMN dependent NADH:quinone oxidoreductase n=1 Tax=Aminobacter aminovorans TaxID=83263 RepID=A0A380WJM2_AMIAI|nr:FMN-dependent NADH-azoreductase [Aminobacter aminovorans]SUU89060.1 FMN-dependent NADH-azoreductase [Aminobacter aminovorans]
MPVFQMGRPGHIHCTEHPHPPEKPQCPSCLSRPARAVPPRIPPASPPNSPRSWSPPIPELVVRDLVVNPLPHIDADYATGIYTPAEDRTQRQAEVVGVSDAVLDELFAANTVILATGFINFNISSTLKSWVDHVARSGKTFAYGENGPAGLVTGKKVYIVLASGGIYSEGAAVQMDHAIPYLRSVLGFIGMTDVEVIRIEGVGMGPDAVTAALAKATAKVDALVAASVQTAIAA